MSRADYAYIKIDKDKKLVLIEDLNLGNMSVTNDAETVVSEILDNYPDYRIAYRDSSLDWDELVHENGQFTGFRMWKNDR